MSSLHLARLDRRNALPAFLLVAALVSSVVVAEDCRAQDLGSVIASAEECSGELGALRTAWWDTLTADPDSLISRAILMRWDETLGLAPIGGPTAMEWSALADRTQNGWNRRRILRHAHQWSLSTDAIASPADLGLFKGVPRRWLGIGPFGQSINSELYENRPALLDYDGRRSEKGLHGTVDWRELPVSQFESSITPSRISWRFGGAWILRSRFQLAARADSVFLSVSTRGSVRLLLDGKPLVTIDREREHLPRVIRVPVSLAQGTHTFGVISDGATLAILLTDPRGNPIPIRELDPTSVGSEAGWEPQPDLKPIGLHDLTMEPVSDRDRAARTLIAILEEDRIAVDRLFPESEIDGPGAPALAIAAERALSFLPWLPSEVTRSRLDRFRAAGLAAEPNLVPIAIAAARTLADEDKIGEAMRALDALTESAPRSLLVWQTRESITREQGWRRERENSLAALASLAPDHSAVLRAKRRAAQDLGRNDLVFDIDKKLFELEPGMGTGSTLASHFVEREDLGALRELVNRLEQLDPGSSQILGLRSRYALRFGEEKMFREALLPQWLEWQPEDPSHWDELAGLQIEKGLLDEAIGSLEEAQVLDPGDHDRANRIAHLRAGTPLPGTAPKEAWEQEIVPLEEILADAPPPGSYPGANAVLLFDQMVSDVSATGGITEMVHQVIRLESQEAIAAYSTLPTAGEVREIAVLTPDGRRLEPTGGSTGGGYTLPGLEPGALIVVRTVRQQDLRRREDLRIGPFYFQDPDFEVAFHRSEWVVRLPADWDPEVLTKGGAEPPVETVADGVRRLAWRVDRAARPEPEPLLPPTTEVLPNVEVRWPLPWSDVLPNMAANGVLDDRTTPTLTAAAAKILAGVTGTRARVTALYEAVCERTTDGNGGNSATAVWLSRDGDRNLLLAGLLRAASIPYQRVYAAPSPERIPWVNWSSPHDANFQLALMEVLDEEGTSIWLNIPSRMAPMDRIPAEVQRGRAIRLTHTDGEWFSMPDGNPLDEAQALIGTITLTGEGPTATLAGALEIRALGAAAFKEQVKNMPPFQRTQMVQGFVQQTLPGSKILSGQLENYTVRDAPFRVAFEIEAPNLIQLRDGVPSLSSAIRLNRLRGMLRTSDRNFPFYNGRSNTSWESLTIELGDYRPIDLPEDVEYDGPWGKFVAKSRLEGNTLHLERLLDMHAFLVEADRWEEFSEFCRQVDRREELRISLEIATP